MSMETFLNLWDDMGMEFHIRFGTSFAHPKPQYACHFGSQAPFGITSEIVANGFALQIVASKRASGKTIRRFRASGQAVRLVN